MKTKSFKFKSILIILLAQVISNNPTIAITATVRGTLPSVINEASGLDFSGSSSYWTHNDGNGNKIFKLGDNGALKATVTVTGASNSNWEDITHNTSRTVMYIGDFGNNNSDRHNLKIYKIPYPSGSTSTTTSASVINFTYPDQHQFPARWLNFDAEGFFHRNGKLFILTKGVGNTIGYTKLYSVPDVPGTYTATLIDSFYVNSRITGAALSPDESSVVLLSNTNIFLFRNFTGNNFFNGTYTKIKIDGSWTQKEGVTFYSNNTIYVVDEGSAGKSHLFSINLTAYMVSPRLAAPEIGSEPIATASVYPNPSSGYFFISTGENYNHVDVLISNLSGQIVMQRSFENPDDQIRLETESLPAGIYAVKIVGDMRREMSTLLSVMN